MPANGSDRSWSTAGRAQRSLGFKEARRGGAPSHAVGIRTASGFASRRPSPACHQGTPPKSTRRFESRRDSLQRKGPRFGGPLRWSQLQDSNLRPADYESAALPAELSWRWLSSVPGRAAGIKAGALSRSRGGGSCAGSSRGRPTGRRARRGPCRWACRRRGRPWSRCG